MQTHRYPQFPPTIAVVHVALFTDVTNASSLRQRIVNAATKPGVEGDAERDALNFAFIDARLITSPLHLRTAVYQALLAESQGAIRTKTVHSEILWALNPSNNISEAIRRFGVSDATTALLVVRVGSDDLTDVDQKMQDIVSGTLSPLTNLEGITDWSTIKKHYKLNTEVAVKDTAGNVSREHAVVDRIVVSSVAMKSVNA
ncbi:hypothetical protein PLICRDRAFT_96194 [Plicaturopsis crispa FD-325 SS-3]|nr:hypothetical protein PLICRDRAFT_96194 [Plicaturopsis crispa FD-325 SS-3]